MQPGGGQGLKAAAEPTRFIRQRNPIANINGGELCVTRALGPRRAPGPGRSGLHGRRREGGERSLARARATARCGGCARGQCSCCCGHPPATNDAGFPYNEVWRARHTTRRERRCTTSSLCCACARPGPPHGASSGRPPGRSCSRTKRRIGCCEPAKWLGPCRSSLSYKASIARRGCLHRVRSSAARPSPTATAPFGDTGRKTMRVPRNVPLPTMGIRCMRAGTEFGKQLVTTHSATPRVRPERHVSKM